MASPSAENVRDARKRSQSEKSIIRNDAILGSGSIACPQTGALTPGSGLTKFVQTVDIL
jgi:hypothetical protein